MSDGAILKADQDSTPEIDALLSNFEKLSKADQLKFLSMATKGMQSSSGLPDNGLSIPERAEAIIPRADQTAKHNNGPSYREMAELSLANFKPYNKYNKPDGIYFRQEADALASKYDKPNGIDFRKEADILRPRPSNGLDLFNKIDGLELRKEVQHLRPRPDELEKIDVLNLRKQVEHLRPRPDELEKIDVLNLRKQVEHLRPRSIPTHVKQPQQSEPDSDKAKTNDSSPPKQAESKPKSADVPDVPKSGVTTTTENVVDPESASSQSEPSTGTNLPDTNMTGPQDLFELDPLDLGLELVDPNNPIKSLGELAGRCKGFL